MMSGSGKGLNIPSIYDRVEETLSSGDPERVRRMMHFYAQRGAEYSAELSGYQMIIRRQLIEKHKPEGARFSGVQVDAVWLVDPDSTPDLPARVENYPPELFRVWGDCHPLIRLDYKTGDNWRDEKTILLYVCPNYQCGSVNTIERVRRITGTSDQSGGQEYALERCTACGQHFHRLHVWNSD